MPRDSIRLIIGSYEFTECQSMEMVSDLYSPSGSFNFSLGQRISAASGTRCSVLINGQMELTGVIDQVEESQDKSSHTWTVTGRSLVGQIEDFYVTSWMSPPTTLAAAAKKYLSEIPYVNELPYSIEGDDPSVSHARLDVGDTAFKLLNEFAMNRGLLFWAKPDGSIIFGKAKRDGIPAFRITGSVVEQRRRVENTSKLHSEIWIVSDSDEGHRTHIAKNASVTVRKPFAAPYNGHDSNGLEKQAAQYLRQEKLSSFQLEYMVNGFSQNGKNWTINELAQVDDDEFGLQDTYLICRRTFRYTRNTGSTASLILSPILAEDVFKAYPKKRKKEEEAW